MPNYLTVAEAQEQLPALSKNLRDPAIIKALPIVKTKKYKS
jgi:hypothetical protein